MSSLARAEFLVTERRISTFKPKSLCFQIIHALVEPLTSSKMHDFVLRLASVN